MYNHYEFTTHWQIKAPLPQVWNAIYDTLGWPQWWKGVIAVKPVEEGDENDIGGVREYTWQGLLPYRLTFTMLLIHNEKHKRLQGLASGELEGGGEWLFGEKNGVTHVQYNWTVTTNKKWMNYLSFILKPVFRLNHNIVMRWGAKGLARKLGAELVSF